MPASRTKERYRKDDPMDMANENHDALQTRDDPRWSAVVDRAASFDGKFVYAVKSTGIYCRPSCPSRQAKPQNVIFFSTSEEAEKRRFRACKRCRPNDLSLSTQHARAIAEACRAIESAEELPALAELAKSAGMSAFYFHRLFKKISGVTPKVYGTARRSERVRERLVDGKSSVTEAIYDAGFNSNGRFYAKSNEVLGMTPTAFRDGGLDTDIKFAVGECSLGSILVARSQKGVCSILFGDDPEQLVRDLQDRFPRANLLGGDRDFEKIVANVVGFVEDPGIGLELPLDVRGTVFQQRVWRALTEIPAGRTASYTEIAERIGAPKSARAVAAACAANKIAVAIPCHRVVRNDGALSGYRWGVDRKRALLKAEAKHA
jgi:AraC family transcriptional regulator of adaptative response/methylated-DNA-[protein]-cysteine methyltransferase